jgi:undecaprenyl-diphosphatase
MNQYVQILVLAIVQGIGEFLPISSSGHLVIVEQLLGAFIGGESIAHGMDVEVFLHLGTLGSILVVYWRDLWALRSDIRLCLMIVAATVPAGAVGVLLKDWFEQAFDEPIYAGFGLLVTAALLTTAQKFERPRFNLKSMPWLTAMIVGLFQAVALVPGISRSGSTISGGLLTGLERDSATRFSFLLAIPVTAGAIMLTVAKKLLKDPTLSVGPGPLLFGIVVAFFVGWVALELLIRVVVRGKLHWFAIYCAIAGCATIAWCLMK